VSNTWEIVGQVTGMRASEAFVLRYIRELDGGFLDLCRIDQISWNRIESSMSVLSGLDVECLVESRRGD